MQLNVTTLVYWKKDHNAQTNEDALDLDVARGLYVVCDGVGEASFSNEWAPVLARTFLERPLFSEDPFELEYWTRVAQKSALPVMTAPETLSGVSRDKARRGAAATLCGMALTPRREHDGLHYGYNLTAIGDSNFFHWRPDPAQGGKYKLLFAFPLKRYADFDSSPDSLNSRHHNRDNVAAHTFSSTPDLDLREGDVLFLATDAVSQWIFREYEATVAGEVQRHPALPLLEIATRHDAQPGIQPLGSPWASYIDRLREGNDIVDDDSVMIVIRVGNLQRGADLRPLDLAPQVKERTKELLDAIGRWLMGGGGDGKGEVRDVDLAVTFGDGSQVDPSIKSRLLTPARFRAQGSDAGSFRASHIDLWRANADSFKRVTDGVRAAMRGSTDARQPDEGKQHLEETWREVREQLVGLLWMRGLVKTLRDLGVEQAEIMNASEGGSESASARVLGDGKAMVAHTALPPAPRAIREGTERVYRAIGDWLMGRGSDAAIVAALDGAPHLDPAFAAAISTPIAVGEGMVSHIDIWRARASGGDSPVTVPPRKKATARPLASRADAVDDAPKSKTPLPPMPGVSGSVMPSAPIEAPKPLPNQPPPRPKSPPESSTTSSGAAGPRQEGPRQSTTASVGYMTAPAAPHYQSAPASNRGLLWAMGGAALLGSILLIGALAWMLASQPPPPPVPPVVTGTVTVTATASPGTPGATGTPTAIVTAVAGANATATASATVTSTQPRATGSVTTGATATTSATTLPITATSTVTPQGGITLPPIFGTLPPGSTPTSPPAPQNPAPPGIAPTPYP